MRTAPLIHDLWQNGGPFIGADGKSNAYVTVQDPWESNDPYVNSADTDHVIHATTLAGTGTETGTPLRWYQKADNSQNERIVPNVKSIQIERGIDNDAATATIMIYNQWMRVNNDLESEGTREIGTHGFFTPNHGVAADAQARWNHTANEWEGVFTPNTIIRTYEGYGGTDKTLADALSDGNVLLTGVWLIDGVTLSTDGMLTVECRDMMKLLISQQLYPPLVPTDRYPIQYYRYAFENRAITAERELNIPIGDRRTVFLDSSADRRDPGFEDAGGATVHGHQAIHALDGNGSTFALSAGYSTPTGHYDWWEFEVQELANTAYVYPWGGNYTTYISVMENGTWQGNDVVPSSSFGANIPYVIRSSVPFDQGVEILLPRLYDMQKIRVTFTNHVNTTWGPDPYRVGLREFRARTTNINNALGESIELPTVDGSAPVNPIFFDAVAHPTSGYFTLSHRHKVDPFGDGRTQNPNGSASSSRPSIGIDITPSGEGYYTVDNAGRVFAFGDAVHYGDLNTAGISIPTSSDLPFSSRKYANDIGVTHTGEGYWVVVGDGNTYAFGDATQYSPVSPSGLNFIRSIAPHPSGMGYWLISTDGTVYEEGAATHYGNFSEASLNYSQISWADAPTEAATGITATAAGDGYWVVTNTGRVEAFGSATEHGQIQQTGETPWAWSEHYQSVIPNPDDSGYIIMRGDGRMWLFGDVDYYGAPIPGSEGQLRFDGNYLDLSDIVKELASWSGFLLFDPNHPGNEPPPLYATIETTGTFSAEPLPDDLFDKRPVIDALTEMKETVGYVLYVDDEGRLRFESPNWWAEGNFDEDGNHLSILPEIDERVNLQDYQVSFNDEALRSMIIISSEDPDESGDTTVTTKLRPRSASGLKGLIVPAMWVNGWFQNPSEQRLMADLIAMHVWFQQRIGSVSCVANPCIQINDQVRIFERTTGETYVHYVRGVSSSHDLDTGEYVMSLTTHWLGDADEWVVTDDEAYIDDERFFVIDDVTGTWVGERSGRSSVFAPGDLNLAPGLYEDGAQ